VACAFQKSGGAPDESGVFSDARGVDVLSDYQRRKCKLLQVFWNIDYHLATPALAERARGVSIYKGEKFSDHAPLTIHYDLHL
jgi:endonuclease/exonuclease/phosphatase family metal-dependent hydrolase